MECTLNLWCMILRDCKVLRNNSGEFSLSNCFNDVAENLPVMSWNYSLYKHGPLFLKYLLSRVPDVFCKSVNTEIPFDDFYKYSETFYIF